MCSREKKNTTRKGRWDSVGKREHSTIEREGTLLSGVTYQLKLNG